MMAVAPKVNNVPAVGVTPKPLGALPKIGAAEAPAAPKDIDITLKNGQTANIGLEEPGKGGPADAAPGLKEIVPMLQELIKTLTGLLEKLGKLVPGGATPADPAAPAGGGPAAPADPAKPADPAAPVAGAAQAGGPAAAPVAGAPGAPGKDGAPGRDGAPAPAPEKPKHHPGLFENIGRFLFGFDE